MSRSCRDMPLLSLSNAALSSLKVSDNHAVLDLIKLACDLVRGFAEQIRSGDKKALEQRGAIIERDASLDLIVHHTRGIDRMTPRGEKELRPQSEAYVGQFPAGGIVVLAAQIVQRAPHGVVAPLEPR